MKELIIYLADDHRLVAEGISSLLSKLPQVADVKTFDNGELLYRACLNNAPNFIFLDIEMPNWNGIKTLKELKAIGVSAPVVILSMIEERAIITQCLELGAMGYMHKDASLEELEIAIQEVLKGEKYLSNEAAKLISGERNIGVYNIEDNSTILLTDREKEILKLICEGFSSKEIGEKLFISHRTVETHKEHLLHKFDVNSTAKLIASSIRKRII